MGSPASGGGDLGWFQRGQMAPAVRRGRLRARTGDTTKWSSPPTAFTSSGAWK